MLSDSTPIPTFAGTHHRYPTPPKLRAKVFKRDQGACCYCGDWADCIDHVVPVAFGGTTTEDNLVAACRFCNNKAQDKLFDTFADKQEWLIQYYPEKISRIRARLMICADCGAFYAYRQAGSTRVLCSHCASLA